MKRRIKPEQVIPFLEHIGVQTTHFERLNATAEVENADELANQMGSMHPAVVYAAAECAAGALITYNFEVSVYVPLIRSVSIRFLAPVFKKAVASAHIEEDALQKADQELQDLGRTDVVTSIQVETESGIIAAEATIVWALRTMAPTTA